MFDGFAESLKLILLNRPILEDYKKSIQNSSTVSFQSKFEKKIK